MNHPKRTERPKRRIPIKRPKTGGFIGMKNNKQILTNQVPTTQSSDQSQIVKELQPAIRNLSPLSLDIANFILEVELQYGKAYPSQISIARRFGVSREHVNRIVRHLREIGYLDSRQRWNNSSVYRVHPTITLLDTAHKLHRYLPALKKILLGLFVVALGAPLSGGITLLNIKLANKNKFNIKKAPSDRWSMHSPKAREAIPTFIKSLPFDLDTAQKVYLCQFPLEALQEAHEKLLVSPNVKKPWPYFISICFLYCAENKLQIDTQWCAELRRHYKINTDVNLGQARVKEPQDEVSTVDHKVSTTQRHKQERQSSILPVKEIEPAKPSIKQQIAAMPRPNSQYSPYSVYQGKPEESMQTRLETCSVEIQKAEENIAKLRASNNPFATEAILILENRINYLQQEFATLIPKM